MQPNDTAVGSIVDVDAVVDGEALVAVYALVFEILDDVDSIVALFAVVALYILHIVDMMFAVYVVVF